MAPKIILIISLMIIASIASGQNACIQEKQYNNVTVLFETYLNSQKYELAGNDKLYLKNLKQKLLLESNSSEYMGNLTTDETNILLDSIITYAFNSETDSLFYLKELRTTLTLIKLYMQNMIGIPKLMTGK